MRSDSITIETAVDLIESGEISSGELNSPVRRSPLPSGVTEKRVLRDVVVIALPSLVELVLTQLTGIADQIMVGRLPGREGVLALSAVGLAAQPKFLLMTMIQALNVGATALIARFRGQQDRAKANRVFSQAIALNLMISTVFMLLGIVLAEPLIRFMSGEGKLEETTIKAGVDYFLIQMYGFIPLCVGFTITASLRGIGETKLPLFYNTLANVINLFFNYVMIYGRLGCPKLGVVGASIATVIGQTAAFVIAMAVVFDKKRYINLRIKEKFRFDLPLIRSLASIGVPSMIEQLLLRAGIIIYTRTVMIGQAFANAATTLMGQSLGKRRYDMAAVYMRRTRMIGILSGVLLGALAILLRRELIAVFNDTPEVIETGAGILFLLAFSQPFQSDQFIVSGGLRGAGDTRYTAVVIAVTVLGVRSGLGLLAVKVFNWGLWGAWIALMADQLLRSALMALRYRSGKWKKTAAIRFASADKS